MTDPVPCFQGEVMLAGWSDSHTSGAKVVLFLPDPADIEIFRGMTVAKGKTAGQRMMCVLVEIDDDETPKTPGDGTPKRFEASTRPGPLCMLAVRWAREPLFQEWLRDRGFNSGYDIGTKGAEAYAASMIREMSGVISRRELNTSTDARAAFETNVRIPFMAWLQTTGQEIS